MFEERTWLMTERKRQRLFWQDREIIMWILRLAAKNAKLIQWKRCSTSGLFYFGCCQCLLTIRLRGQEGADIGAPMSVAVESR